MEFVAGGIAFEFLDPEGAAVRGRGAVPAAAMPLPEAAAEAMQQGTGDALRRAVVTADARNTPLAMFWGQSVPIHRPSLTTNIQEKT
jgi:hypothetical protein